MFQFVLHYLLLLHSDFHLRRYYSIFRVRAQPIEKPKNINSLDGLWRRMRQATENYRLFHKKDAMITEVMSAARAEAYDAMVKKNSQEKQRLLKTNKEAEKD